MEDAKPRPFDSTSPLPAGVRIPWWLGLITGVAVAAGVSYGAVSGGGPLRLVRALFFGSAFGYLTTSLVDFWEHVRMEKEVTGHYLRATVVPIGETLNHALTISLILTLFALGRPLPPSLALRDWIMLAGPAGFLLLGWRDELVYHRRRATHREDIMHTVSHLAAGVMLTSFYVMRLMG